MNSAECMHDGRTAAAEAPRNGWADVAGAVTAAMVPVLFMFRVLVPNQPWSRMIGNDFASLYFYKLWLLDGLSRWTLPFWSPGEACGFPFYSNPFAQAFYPLNIPLAWFYKVMGGYSYHDHQVFTVLGMALFAVGLYAWLRSLGIARLHALMGTAVASTSCKMSETIRFYLAVHTIAWLPFALWGCTLALQPRRRVMGATLLCVSLIMMATAGYLYYLYYAAGVLAIYVAVLCVPWARAAVYDASAAPIGTKRFLPGAFFAALGTGVGVALLLCAPYLLKMRSLLAQTVNRGGANYSFSTANSFTLTDTIGSLVFPPAACMEGWYYFGVGMLLLLIAFLARSLHDREAVRDRRLWLLAISCFLVVTSITHGGCSWLFWVLWHALPGFSSLREWSRLNIVLVPLIALLVARACEWVARMAGGRSAPAGTLAWCVLSAGTVAVLAAQMVFIRNNVHNVYWQYYFLCSVPDGFDTKCFLWFTMAGAVVVAAIIAVPRMTAGHASCVFNLCLVLLFALTVWDVGRIGCMQWILLEPPPTQRRITRADWLTEASLATPRKYSTRTGVPITTVFYTHVTPDWYFNRYLAFIERENQPFVESGTAQMSAEFRRITGMSDGTRFFFSKALDHSSLAHFLDDATHHAAYSDFRVHVHLYTGDDFAATVYTTHAGYFSFIDNWDSDWRASVNDQPVDIKLLFGTFKSVALPPGTNLVVFSYRPHFW